MLEHTDHSLLAHETLDAQRILEDSGLPPGPAPETDHLAVLLARIAGGAVTQITAEALIREFTSTMHACGTDGGCKP